MVMSDGLLWASRRSRKAVDLKDYHLCSAVVHISLAVQGVPLWLILEIKCRMAIRPGQVKVGQAIIHLQPRSVFLSQKIKDEGMSSCIIPFVATIHTDKETPFQVGVANCATSSRRSLSMLEGSLVG